MRNFFTILGCYFFLTSCVATPDKRGFVFEMSDHELVQEGVTSKERVLRMLGSPTLISDLDGNETWIYFSENLKSFLFFRPKIINREILIIRFSREDSTIRELKRIGLESEEKRMQFVSDYTAVDNHKTGFFKSIFSNVGQIKPQ